MESFTVIHEDSTEIPDYVDDKEDGPFFRSHCKIATLGIASHWMGLCRLRKEVVYFGRTAEIGVCCISREGENQDYDEDHDLCIIL